MNSYLMTRRGIAIIMMACFCISAGWIYAQDTGEEKERPFTITVDAVMDAFFIRTFNGDYSTKEPAATGSPYKYQGNGDMKVFQTSAFDDSLNARTKFTYSNEKLGGLLLFMAQPDVSFADSWDWEAWLRFNPHLKLTAGNQAKRGQVAYYQKFDDFLKTKVDPFGILVPVWKANPRDLGGNSFDTTAEFPWGVMAGKQIYGYALFTATDTNDLLMPAGPSPARQKMGLVADMSYEPVTLSVSVGGLYESISRPYLFPWLAVKATVENGYDNKYDPVVTTGTHFGLRAEGAKIADMLSVAATYKYAESTLSKLEANDSSARINEQVGNHAFGVYLNTEPLIPGLGISVGYSGLIQTWKNSEYLSTTVIQGLNPEESNAHVLSENQEVVFPYYSGIDLRLSYTGVENLSITLNNNLSFAKSKGNEKERAEKFFSKAWAYEGTLNEGGVANLADRSETYLGLYNALGVQYRISDSLTADLQIANQLGLFTLDWEKDPAKSSTDYLGLYAGVIYQVYKQGNIRGSIRGGFDMRLGMLRYQDDKTAYKYAAGYTDIGIPLGIKVEF